MLGLFLITCLTNDPSFAVGVESNWNANNKFDVKKITCDIAANNLNQAYVGFCHSAGEEQIS